MKKCLSLILTFLTVFSLFAACSSDGTNNATTTPDTTESKTETITKETSENNEVTAPSDLFDFSEIPKKFEGTLEQLAISFDYMKSGNYTATINFSETEPELHIKDSSDKEISDSILTYNIADFDGDGNDELLIIAADRHVKVDFGIYNTTSDNVYAYYMYETDGKTCTLSAKMSPVVIDCIVPSLGNQHMKTTIPFWDSDFINTEIIRFEHNGKQLIFAEVRNSAVAIGDGTSYFFTLTEYDGRNFKCVTGFEYAGSHIDGIAIPSFNKVFTDYIPTFSMKTMYTTTKNISASLEKGSFEKLINIYSDKKSLVETEKDGMTTDYSMTSRFDNFIN